MKNTNPILPGLKVTIKEYGPNRLFRVVKQLKEYKAPVFLVEPINHKSPKEFNGKMSGSALTLVTE